MPDGEFVGRVLLASLHQAIGEVLPSRLGFYEHWLTPDAAPGVASFMAMLSNLQQDGEAFDLIARRAGYYAAVRSFQGLSPLKRTGIRMLPRGMRATKAVGLLSRILPPLYPETRVDVTRRRSTVFVGIEGSPFCAARGSAEPALCSFYSGAITRFLELFNLRPSVRVRGCQSMGMRTCLLMVLPDHARGAAAESGVAGVADDVTIASSQEVAGTVEIALRAMEPPPVADPAPVADTSPVVDIAPVADDAPPETAPLREPAPQTESAPPAETVPPAEIVAVAEKVIVAETIKVAETRPLAKATPTGVASTPAAPPDVSPWDAIVAKRRSRKDWTRLNLDALFTRPGGGEDAEAPWHRLDEG